MEPNTVPLAHNEALRELLERLPIPLVLMDDAAQTELVSDQFSRICTPDVLATTAIRQVMAAPGAGWRLLKLAQRDGTEVDVQARAMRFHEHVLLMIDETPGVLPSPAVEDMRLRLAELERASTTDRLTGAWNRAHLDRIIDSEVARSERLRQPLTLLLIDIDHFKRVNDEHGHQAGDSVLCDLVGVVTKHVRAADLLFRWGGEEFVVLATATTHTGGTRLAENLRAAVAAHCFPAVGELTISLGVAERLNGESPRAWFERVDEQLYSAKRNGRNRAVVDPRGASDRWVAERANSALELVWQEAYECGDATIDRQHRNLFELANTVVATVLAGSSPKTEVTTVLDELMSHLLDHFRDEESILVSSGYPRAAAHKRAHAALVARATELRAAAEAGRATVGHLLEFLAVDVVARHMLTADKDFFPWVAAHAASAAKPVEK
ncbi:MAG: diguanylate cyclase [Planctomycetes bacterium]|nr:diguanylate cyclase [Planctomycetota bacterium]